MVYPLCRIGRILFDVANEAWLLLLFKSACLVWRSIITAALDLAKSELSLNGSTVQHDDVEFQCGSLPLAIHKFLSLVKQLDLDLAIR